MDKKTPITENQFPAKIQIDEMNLIDAFNFFLSDHQKVFKVINDVQEEIILVIKECSEHLKKNKDSRIIFVGAGTSGRIGVQEAVELFPTFNWPKKRVKFLLAGGKKSLTESIENAEDDKNDAIKQSKSINITSNDIVIGLAASGNTPFTVSVLKYATNTNALTIAISNNKFGKILKYSTYKIVLDTREEVVSGSTRLKAGTSQKIILNLITTLIMINLGFVKKGLMTNLVPTNKKLITRQKRIKKYFLK